MQSMITQIIKSINILSLELKLIEQQFKTKIMHKK